MNLINTNVQAPEWTFTTETTQDGEYVTNFCLWRNGALFARIPAEAEGTPYAEQESGLKALCVAGNAHSAIVSALVKAEYSLRRLTARMKDSEISCVDADAIKKAERALALVYPNFATLIGRQPTLQSHS